MRGVMKSAAALLPPVRRFLINRHIGVPEDWLSECVQWVLDNHSQDHPWDHVPFVQEQVYQEWLHADLRELETSCLPPQTQEESSTTISGHFPLQINLVHDVRKSAYKQLKKIEGADNKNAKVSATQEEMATKKRKTRKRMLMLEMSDGTTTVEGMEYQPIPNLSVDLSPGTKVMVFGTVKVRRGILFLTHENITVLGGKVVNLLERNNQRNVLTAALNLQGTGPQQRSSNSNTQSSRQIHSSSANTVSREVRSQNSNGISTALPPTHDDEELDFFDGELLESGFDEDMTLEGESIQDPAVETEFTQDLALENEFDDDLDTLMSQF